MIPTYNEAENIGAVVSGVLSVAGAGDEVLVVDDSSPDGTGEVVEEIGRGDPRVRLLSRPGPRGRGWAGRDGFLRALQRGADRIVEMDGDGSHDPEAIPRLIEALPGADVVIGSRFLPGGKALGRGWLRGAISLVARRYIRLVLGIAVTDPTSGYRLFSRKALEKIDPATLTARDPFAVTEILYRCHRAGLRIKEVPIVFKDREKGESKLETSMLLKYFFRVLKLRLVK